MVRLFLILYLLLLKYTGVAQVAGFVVPPNKESINIPFQFENNFILIKVLFNKTFPLIFILDTGSENTILVKKSITDLMAVKYDKEYKVYGADLSNALTVHLVKNVNLDLYSIRTGNVPILVLEEDYFNFEKYTGLKIHGILGMDLFKLTTIQIDYRKKILTLYPPNNYKVSKKHQAFPVESLRNKIYMSAKGAFQNKEAIDIKLLIDTGANLSLLLHNNSDSAITLPPKLIPGKLGDGLGGLVEGYMGRISTLAIGEYSFSNVVTHFQEVPIEMDPKSINNRNGILGNAILSRFNIVIAPFDNLIYLKPEKKYNATFKFDKSGITLISSGLFLTDFTVMDVIPNSPAAAAGIEKGDKLLKINGIPTRFYHLETLTRKFERRSGKRFKLVLKRNGQIKKVAFRLKDLI